MALPAQFLDELRARITLSSVIGRRVKLIRRGREHVGLCPFHKEKSPSFTVNDDKGFYHCFGCGAHGDVLTFEMEQGNLGFMEAVEKLAAEAGLEVPKSTPREAEDAKRRAGVLEVLEAACAFFQQNLFLPAGQDGIAYLRRRGLTDAIIRQFRLGWAPGGGVLKGALARQGIGEDQLVEAGLLKRRDDGSLGEYFRERVMFPITDRRGRVIAFGARTLGDGQPKYLNSPETPVFHKGQVLFNLAQAREPAGKANEVVVAEGYMDVIALTRGGIPQAVAPLGTALTETQIEELWKLAEEPILCFDGDNAGQRAAARAAERALTVLKPGRSLRFALLPGGRDPDEILRDEGPQALRAALSAARPLMDMLWSMALEGRDLSTPERRAALEAHLDEMTREIEDRTVQQYYRQAFRDRLRDLFRPQRPAYGGGRPGGAGGWTPRGGGKGWGNRQPPRWSAPLPPLPPTGMLVPKLSAESAEATRRRILVATALCHPALFDHIGERLGSLDLPEPDLDKIRRALLILLGREPGLDFNSVKSHLHADGLESAVRGLLSSNVWVHAAFCRPDADLDAARTGWDHTFELTRRIDLKADIDRIVEQLGDDPTPETFETFVALKGHERMPGDE
ncbi:DNA primase [Novispirillum itersonii]|uniref:DNA primase n=1 Tax=Novispirillum itersonii TaxID=189 RepID=UPI00036065C2|nr:DNA primase [Novispirillum itersonii]